MGQDILEMNYGTEALRASEARSRQPRPLTYDEKRAAQAAFEGQPFNPAWSAAAQVVYEGILAVLVKR